METNAIRSVRCGNTTINLTHYETIRSVKSHSRADGKDVYLVCIQFASGKILELEHDTPENADATRAFIEAAIGPVPVMPLIEKEADK